MRDWPRRIVRSVQLFLLLCLVLPLAATGTPRGPDLAQEIDAVMSGVYKPGGPGATIIVVKDGKTLFRKGYGLANLELGVAMAPDMVLRLGSVTKQFTAVAILMLAEEGKLTLLDEIGKFLPDFPTQGQRVTIEHLLTHTSGIPSYTDMQEWLKMWRQDLTPGEIIALSKDKPFEFTPGQRWKYDNTGYVMLGAIIEKVSGQSYETFIQDRIFTPLKMKSSRYDHSERITPGRAAGYQQSQDGFVNAPFLSMTQPYAAGSLMSSVDDLAVWHEAIFSGRLLKKEWLDRAFTPARTSDGESTGYGYGWFSATLQGHRTIEHGGGIHGFTSYTLALPDDRIYVAILTNSTAGERAPQPRAERIAELILGLRGTERKPVVLTTGELDALTGVYEAPEGQSRAISREGAQLFSQRIGGARYPLQAASTDVFFFPDSETALRFTRDARGKATGLRLEARLGPAEIYRRSDKPLPTVRREIALDARLLERLAGEYELMPGFTLRITVEEGHLMSQATGQGKFELFAETATRFFLKVVDAQVEFDLDQSGLATGLTLFQGGQRIPGRKVK